MSIRAAPFAPLRRHTAPALVVASGLLATLAAWRYVDSVVTAQHDRRVNETVDAGVDAIRERMDAYAAKLRATRGFFRAHAGAPGAAAFAEFVRSLELVERYPGIQGIGWTEAIPPARLAAHERAVRETGRSGYRVWPAGDRDLYTSIVFLEPLDWRNARALGYDMFSEPTRRAAMARARDTGEITASGKVELVQEAGAQRQAGFLLYLPVYSGEPRSVDERRALLRGWVYAPFRAADLLHGAVGEAQARGAGMAVYDGPAAAPGALLFAAPRVERASTTALRPIEISGRTWTLAFALPEVLPLRDRLLPATVVAVGLALTALLAWVTLLEARARAAAEEALRERDDFLSVASHELKTPLTSLVLQAASLRTLARRAGDPSLAAKTDVIRRNVDRLARLVSSLLDLSRIRAGAVELEIEDVDLAELTGDVVSRFEDEAERTGSRVVLDAPEPVVGRWDRLRVDQVVTNLLSNALKYGRGGSVHVSVAAAGSRAVVAVRDHGIGISPADQRRIFERFTRAVSKRHYGGFGLGLWIVREIVEQFGGTVSVESTPERGATFTVELERGPVARDLPRPGAAERPRPADRDGARTSERAAPRVP